MAMISRSTNSLVVSCPDCQKTHSLAPNQAGYQIAVSEALDHATIARIKCGCDISHLDARAELVSSMGNKTKRVKRIKRIVRLVSI